MTRISKVLALTVVVGAAAPVHAQVGGSGTGASTGSEGVSDVVEGAGVKVGEGTVVHPVLGIEVGVINNVFFESEDVVTSGLLRVSGALAVGSLPPERLQRAIDPEEPSQQGYGDFAFRADINARYEEYLSSNEAVRAQRDIALGAMLRGVVNPMRTWQFAFTEDFERDTRPVNFESSDSVDRDINRLQLELRFKPSGRALSGSLRYENVIDYFEADQQQFANRIQHTAALQVAWQPWPVTRFHADASLGFFGGFGSDSTRPDSMPLRLGIGAESALTVKTFAAARIGFAKGFYDTGPDFTNVTGALRLGYRFSPFGLVVGQYEFDYHDSINANFYRDHAINARLEQLVRDRVALNLGAEVRFRLYEGVLAEVMGSDTNRSDLIFAVSGGATFNFRDWIAATLDYKFVTDQTDFRYMPEPGLEDDPSYTRHIVMAGVRAAY
jgi:hypothetical protein